MEFLDTIQQQFAVCLRQKHGYKFVTNLFLCQSKKYAFLRIALGPGMNYGLAFALFCQPLPNITDTPIFQSPGIFGSAQDGQEGIHGGDAIHFKFMRPQEHANLRIASF
jgi:hypothetical protein